MTTALFSVDPGPRVHNIKAIGPVMGLDVFQTHRMAKRLNLPGWRIGQGGERRLSTLEVFLLKVAGQANGVLPTEAIRNLTSCAAVYFCAVENDPALRAKPADIMGYTIAGGAWVFLLGHSGKWPDDPPPRHGPFMFMIRVSETLAEVLRGVGETWPAAEAMPEAAAELQEALAAKAKFEAKYADVQTRRRKAGLEALP